MSATSDWAPDPTSTPGASESSRRIGWIDATAGASGDMLLGAALDAGASLDTVNAALAALGLPEPLSVGAEVVTRAGIRANRALVHAPDTAHSRPWSVIRELLSAADLAVGVRTRAIRAFELLAAAEAWVHGTTPAEVIFHEVGGLDALADIVGVCAAVDELSLDRVYCSAVGVGSGTVATAHGSLPVPTPATVQLLTIAGAPVTGTAFNHEACTPTGAALLAGLVDHFRLPIELRVLRTGTGAGTRDPADHPNITRLLIGSTVAATESDASTGPGAAAADLGGAAEFSARSSVEVTANVDDCDPRIWPYVIEQCLRAGADDAWITPIWMKKGRAAVSVHALCGEPLIGTIGTLLVQETTTIGYRIRQVHKHALGRRQVTVYVGERPVRVKLGYDQGRCVNASAEYEDAAAAARESGQPLREVMRIAVELARGQRYVFETTVFETTPGGESSE